MIRLSRLQRLVRKELEGKQTIEGMLLARFEPGQRTAAAHIAFCPPLAAVPSPHIEIGDGPAATVNVTRLLTYGARLEVRLTEPAEEETAADRYAAGLLSANNQG